MGLKLTSLLFFVGIILAVLSFLLWGLYSPPLSYAIPIVLIALIDFLGVFITGWAMISFAVLKEMLQKQRLIAILFAVILVTAVFISTQPVIFAWTVGHLH